MGINCSNTKKILPARDFSLCMVTLRLSGSGEHKPMSGGISAAMAKQRQHHKDMILDDLRTLPFLRVAFVQPPKSKRKNIKNFFPVLSCIFQTGCLVQCLERSRIPPFHLPVALAPTGWWSRLSPIHDPIYMFHVILAVTFITPSHTDNMYIFVFYLYM